MILNSLIQFHGNLVAEMNFVLYRAKTQQTCVKACSALLYSRDDQIRSIL